MIIQEVEKILKNSKTILIMGHKDPDGDAIGSSLSLYNALKEYKKDIEDIKIDVYQSDRIKKLDFLKGNLEIKTDKNLLLKNYDCIITVDTASKDMLGTKQDALFLSDILINIDHHKTNTMYGDFNIVDGMQPAAAQVVYELLRNFNIDISKDTMECIITGIITDTGSFRYSLTNEETLNIAKEALAMKISFDEIESKVFSKTRECFMLENLACKRLEFLDINGKEKKLTIATTYILPDDKEYINSQNTDTETIVNIGRSIENVDISIFARPDHTYSDFTKISMRSNDFDISDVAKYFNGGGHRLAAGCSIKETPIKALEQVVERIKKIIK